MQVQVRFYQWDGRYWGTGPFRSLREARDRLGLHYLERDRHPDLPELLADVGANRAYTQTARSGVWVMYAWRPEPPARDEWVSEPLAWPRTAKPGEMKVLAGGELVECHVCGERGTLDLSNEGLRDVIRSMVRRVWVEDDGRLTIEGALGGNVGTVYPLS